MRFELTTSTLARLRSTPELHPHEIGSRICMLIASFQVKISREIGNERPEAPESGFSVRFEVNICNKENLKPASMSFTLPHA